MYDEKKISLAMELVEELRFSIIRQLFECGACNTRIIKMQNQVMENYEPLRWDTCPNPDCNQVNIFVANKRVYPANLAIHLAEEIPSIYSERYRKSHRILDICPEASAASSRKCLEIVLIDELKIDASPDLFAKINFSRDKISSTLFSQLHYLREIGNFGAHPRKNTHSAEILPVEPGEAEYCLQLLLDLFDECFVKPKRRSSMEKNINEKLKLAGKKTLKFSA